MNRIKIVAFLAVSLSWISAAAASSFDVLYSFCAEAQCGDGSVPYGQLVIASSGALYGTTSEGGTAGGGTAFALTPDGHCGWTHSVLHNFCTGDCADGSAPFAGLIRDGSGKLYGTTTQDGVAFRLDPATQQFDVLANVGDSYAPLAYAGSVYDGASPLFGTTATEGQHGKGSMFELVPRDNGTWRKKVRWDFCAGGGGCLDGANPYGGLAFDKQGRLLGVTQLGGGDAMGVAFRFSKHGWRQKVLFSMCCSAGGSPKYVILAPDHFDTQHHFYLTTSIGGRFFGGTFLELIPNEGGVFLRGDFSGTSGTSPLAGVVTDPDGNALGTASKGGNTSIDPDGGGTIFEYFHMTHGLNGVHQFCLEASCADGDRPAAALAADGAGNYYGTTTAGGVHGKGIVFRFRP